MIISTIIFTNTSYCSYDKYDDYKKPRCGIIKTALIGILFNTGCVDCYVDPNYLNYPMRTSDQPTPTPTRPTRRPTKLRGIDRADGDRPNNHVNIPTHKPTWLMDINTTENINGSN